MGRMQRKRDISLCGERDKSNVLQPLAWDATAEQKQGSYAEKQFRTNYIPTEKLGK